MFGFIGKGFKKLGRAVGRGINVRSLHDFFNFSSDVFSKILRRDKMSEPDETFAQAVERLQLTEEQLKARAKIFKVQIIIYVVGALLVAAYSFYLGSQGYWISILISLLILAFLVINALKSHFWLFQLNQRKLGCTLQEWLNSSVKESK